MLYDNLAINKKENSEIELVFEIPIEAAATYRKKALKKLGESVDIPGFRKGHVPENVLNDRLGEQVILKEAAGMALAEVYPTIVRDEGLSVIGQPHATITKLAPGNPIGIKIETALVPEIILPDYKNLAKSVMPKKISVEVTDKEVEDLVNELRRNKWRIAHKDQAERGVLPKEEELPELDDETVKTLGNFKNVADFKTRAREGLLQEKERKVREGRRLQVGESMIKEANISLPNILVESELNNMMTQFKHGVKHMNLTYEDYLKRINKTEDDLRAEWKEQATTRAKLQLVLNEIAKEENIKPDKKKVEHEVERLLTQFKDADEERVRIYAVTTLANEEVFQFLERQT